MADGYSGVHETSDHSERSNKPQSFGLSYVSPPEQGNGDQVDAATQRPSAQPRKRVIIDTIPANSSAREGLLFPQSANPLLSQNSSGENTPDLRRERFNPEVGTFEDFKRDLSEESRHSRASVNDYQAYLQSSETERLRGAPSVRSAYENDFHPVSECPTSREFYQSRFTCLNILIFLICAFSCAFSGILLFLAVRAPRYGKRINSQGSFTPANAILVTTIVGKVVELSFIASFVAFLGQVLSRRAFMKADGRGVTLSELSMWRWVVQPGTIITHWETTKFAGLTLLGILSLLSTLLATFYSSAVAALVQPMLTDGRWEDMVLAGQVKTDYANNDYIRAFCPTPIRTDKLLGGSTCLQIEHAGQGYHNYHRYLAFWDQIDNTGNATTNQKLRQPGFGLLYENITITGQWINTINTAETSNKYGRVINNVTLAMPHSGVAAAASDKRNGILQPEELNSEGTYSLRASLPSPALNVLCANMNKDELKPIIYDEWSNEVVNITTWPMLSATATTTNKTIVDDIFGWKDDNSINYPPVFPKYPSPFNTIMNHTSWSWGRDSIYLLGQGGADNGTNFTGTYVICKLHAEITPDCSTRYNVTGSGGTMEALCEDDKDKTAFIQTHPDSKPITSVVNWRDIGTDWSNSLSLNSGIGDEDASNARLLMQLILKPTNSDSSNPEVDLNPLLPSIGEALAVMSSCTLLKVALDAPFVMNWNHSTPLLDKPETQYFSASLKAQQYASGGPPGATKAWLAVLILVFLMNIFVLGYFILHRGLVTDFSDPPNLFAIAVNSPPSYAFAGSCGGGPEGNQYGVNWLVKNEGDHIFMEPGERTSLLYDVNARTQYDNSPTDESAPLQAKPGFLGFLRSRAPRKNQSRTKLASGTAVESLRAPSIRSFRTTGEEYEMDDARSVQSSRTQQHYEKLANRRSRL